MDLDRFLFLSMHNYRGARVYRSAKLNMNTYQRNARVLYFMICI